jgi:hypothetical protein
VSTGADWVQFSSPWNSGTNTTATLSIIDTNGNYDASGDDFALDDISFSTSEASATPEPASIVVWSVLLSVGSLGFLFARRRFARSGIHC